MILSTAEHIKHLKYSYGTNGFGNGVFDVWRDGKGVCIKKAPFKVDRTRESGR